MQQKTLDLSHYAYSSLEKQSNSIDFEISKKKEKPYKVYVCPSQSLKKILSWRQTHEAPVDTMGCQRLADKNQPIQIQKYQTLVSLMLSIQTKDQTTAMIVERLKKYGLRPNTIGKINEEEMVDLIYEANFNRRKAKNIIEMSKNVAQKGMPKTKEDIMKFGGVGVKIAMIYMRTAEGANDGIGVDVHVHRIANRLGWTKTKNPNETQQNLQKVFPKQEWKGVNIGLVGFGQILCSAKKPLCKQCPIGKQCKSYGQFF